MSYGHPALRGESAFYRYDIAADRQNDHGCSLDVIYIPISHTHDLGDFKPMFLGACS